MMNLKCLKSEEITVTTAVKLLSELSSGIPDRAVLIRLQTHADGVRYSEQNSGLIPTSSAGSFINKNLTVDIFTGTEIKLIVDDGGTSAALTVTYYGQI